ncbi:MAG: hypothetical protein JOZ41_14890, partial [Chloroflexi bacterium]|nr:hypothetical protein [Chloroflexota bacterium]
IKGDSDDGARSLVQEAVGQRFNDYNAAAQRLGIRGVEWYLQHTPAGVMLAMHIEAPDPRSSLGELIVSKDPFDRWLKERIRAITGVDLNAGPPNDLIAEYLAEYRSSAT